MDRWPSGFPLSRQVGEFLDLRGDAGSAHVDLLVVLGTRIHVSGVLRSFYRSYGEGEKARSHACFRVTGGSWPPSAGPRRGCEPVEVHIGKILKAENRTRSFRENVKNRKAAAPF